jgi:hypothetical protein
MDIIRDRLYVSIGFINPIQAYINNIIDDNNYTNPPPFANNDAYFPKCRLGSYVMKLLLKIKNTKASIHEENIKTNLGCIKILIYNIIISDNLLLNCIGKRLLYRNNIKSKLLNKIIKLPMDIKKLEEEQIKVEDNKYDGMSQAEVITEASKTGKFPILYNIDNRTRKKKFWSIDVNTFDDNTSQIIVKYGIEGSDKIQTKITRIIEGKNKGKKSETSPYEQAIKQAISKFKCKLKNMSFDKENLTMVSKRIYPMLANDYSKIKPSSKTKMKFPCAVQIKYDGDRCTANCVIENGEYKIELRGRDRNIISNCKHIEVELLKLFKNIDYDPNLYLDGEIYKMGMLLQTINGLVRRTNGLETSNNIDNAKELEYHVFDCFMLNNLNIQFKDRSTWIKNAIGNNHQKIIYVGYVLANTEDEMIKLTHEFINKGYEGAILRDIYSPYILASSKSTGRSNYLQKYKIGKYDTAIIKDLEEKPNVSGFGFVFHCIHTASGSSFKINANGSVEYRKNVFLSKEQYINRLLRYKYNDETKAKIPRFAQPVLDKNGSYIITMPDTSSLEEKINQLLTI